ncbi:MAG: energy-coupling factor transporter transmembrane protein EcfT [Chroococcidiopsidaceae cyanobacterium CP_BM_RX_35]|nr:energy-coupling factor transporter transmembrane protein EcfT [Chroococcidiopsidaceae cyanobacterium CP_BM_RX_35]
MDLLRSLPLGLYLERPITWLHRLDPRVKLAWLLSVLATPILANSTWRILLVGLLILLTFIAAIPLRVWRQQLGWLLMLSLFILVIAAVSPDSLSVEYQPRLPVDEIAFAQHPPIAHPQRRPWYNPIGLGQKPATQGFAGGSSGDFLKQAQTTLPQPTDYRYVLLHQGIFRVSRRSLNMAVNYSTLLFTLIYSSNLYLLTTAPEEITAGIESLMQPLRRLKWPITEINLTLTLSLRFIPLVLEEVQNLSRSIQTRAINWKKLGLKGAVRVWMMVAERLLENLLLRAEQMSSAMVVRGFTSPNTHQVQWHHLRLKTGDWMALLGLVMFWGARLLWGNGA